MLVAACGERQAAAAAAAAQRCWRRRRATSDALTAAWRAHLAFAVRALLFRAIHVLHMRFALHGRWRVMWIVYASTRCGVVRCGGCGGTGGGGCGGGGAAARAASASLLCVSACYFTSIACNFAHFKSSTCSEKEKDKQSNYYKFLKYKKYV